MKEASLSKAGRQKKKKSSKSVRGRKKTPGQIGGLTQAVLGAIALMLTHLLLPPGLLDPKS